MVFCRTIIISKNFLKPNFSSIIYKKNFHTSILNKNSQLLQINRSRTRLLFQHFENKSFIRNTHYLNPLPFPVEEGLVPLFSPVTLLDLYEYQGSLIEDLNKLTDETEFMDNTIFELIDKTAQVPENALIFNHASQIWNNDFFFQSLTKKNSSRVDVTDLNDRIRKDFGAIDNFREHFKNMALGIFGSGWTWLVETEFHVLRVVNTYNAGTTLDVTRTQEKDPNNHPTPYTSPFLYSSKANALDVGVNKPSPPPFIKLALQPSHKSKENYIDNFWDFVNWETVQRRTLQRNSFV
ncbi:superoxide dismutase [Rhizophagus clarus]|uniref:Superoxide dismutase n=1 Tax=Rhizophagus clarus TaxID=94130 RepID=A0A8H3LM78_9GLOM|nr:superoxide dismutase [Rhizophagus clarus]